MSNFADDAREDAPPADAWARYQAEHLVPKVARIEERYGTEPVRLRETVPQPPTGIERSQPAEREPSSVVTPVWCDAREAQLIALLKAARSQHQTCSADEIGATLGVDPRKARALIAHCRKDHDQPILSTPSDGYFWPARLEDGNHTLAQLKSRRIEIEASADGIRRGLVREFGTGELWT